MAPKKADPNKKLTKQELKALKKELKEKRKEEARKAAEEKERLAEEERKRLEEEARLAWEAEQAHLQAEHDRISKEKEDLSFYYKWRSSILADFDSGSAVLSDWKRYLDASALPYAGNERQMNQFFSTVAESYDVDYDGTLSTICDIFKVFAETEELAMIEEQRRNAKFILTLKGYLKRLEELAQKRIDHTTAYLLSRSHDFWKQYGDSSFYGILGEWKLFLWVNHAKNPRKRLLEVPALSATISLPKSLTFANVAIRFYHQLFDPLLQSCNAYISVGGVFVLDVLAVPAPPKSVKSWIVEHVTTMTNSVVYVGYQPTSISGTGVPPSSGAPSPIGLELELPNYVIVFDHVPEIGWWDGEEKCWKKDGITDITYERTDKKLKFETLRATSHAVIQSRARQFPYKSWILKPLSENEALLTLNTNLTVLNFEIGSGWCRLVEPSFAECKHLEGRKLSPRILLKQLSRCGMHLLPEDDDAQFIKTSFKDLELEYIACSDLALAIPACAVASSNWNAYAGYHSCIVRILEIPEPLFSPTFEKSKNVKLVIYKTKGNAMLDLRENKSKEYTEQLLTEYHASLLVTLQDYVSKETLDKMQKGDPAYTESFKNLAFALRLFSFACPIPDRDVPVSQELEISQATEVENSSADNIGSGQSMVEQTGNNAVVEKKLNSENILNENNIEMLKEKNVESNSKVAKPDGTEPFEN